MKKITAKLAKETVRASYPESCCRFGWKTVNGVREEFYEIYATRAVTSTRIGTHWKGPLILGRGATRAEAWLQAAKNLLEKTSKGLAQ